MEDKKKVGEVKDIGGTVYSIFLHIMLFSQLGLMAGNVYRSEILPMIIHMFGLFYFLLRIHVFSKLKNKANSAGYSLIDYLRDKYGA